MYSRFNNDWIFILGKPVLSYPVLSPRSSSMGTASMGLSPSKLIFFMDWEISLSFSPATNWAYTVGRSSRDSPLLPRRVRAIDISWNKKGQSGWGVIVRRMEFHRATQKQCVIQTSHPKSCLILPIFVMFVMLLYISVHVTTVMTSIR